MSQLALLELLLAGFFAVACFRARSAAAGEKPTFASFFQLSGRLERLRRSRWQWFAMVAILLVLRLQRQLPLSIEIMAGVLFLIFLALPARALVVVGR